MSERDMDAAYSGRLEPFTRERMLDLHLKYHETVPMPPKFVKAERRFTCGAKGCDAKYKSMDELERHYEENHAA